MLHLVNLEIQCSECVLYVTGEFMRTISLNSKIKLSPFTTFLCFFFFFCKTDNENITS